MSFISHFYVVIDFLCFCICSLEKKMFYSKKEDTMLRPLLAFLMAFRIGLTTPQKQPKDCQFPSTWEGTWYHSGFPHPLNISARHISSKGTCVQQSGSMFIMVDRYVIFLISCTFISSIPIFVVCSVANLLFYW